MSDIYIPPNCKTLAESPEEQIRLGLQGRFNTGKTWSALTFPNPVVLNLDRGVGAHRDRTDVIEVPLWNQDYCKSVNPSHNAPHKLKDTIRVWIDKEGRKLRKGQTLVFDGNTGLQNAYHKAWEKDPVYTDKGKIDDWGEWRLKISYYGDITETFKQLSCDVIFIIHETDKKEKSGEFLGRVAPLLTGQFEGQIGSHFTDWFRQLPCDKKKLLAEIKDEDLSAWKMTRQELSQACKEWGTDETFYYWQCMSDNIFDAKAGSLVKFPKFMSANYASFRKYMKGVTK